MLLLLACVEEPGETAGTTTDTADTGTTGPLTFCDHIRGGAPGGRDPVVELAEAHARLRYFGPDRLASDVDAALAAALVDSAPSDDPALLTAILGGATDRCVVPTDAALGPVSVTTGAGGVLWVVPGTGALTLPDGDSVVIDLRTLPAGADTDAAIRTAVAASLGSTLTLPESAVRTWNGSVDQLYSQNNVYTVDLVTTAEALAPTGTTDRSIFIVTGKVLAPEAARWAAMLRTVGRAAIVGADVDAAVAELSWVPVGAQGFAWKARDLAVPDLIPADLGDPDAAFADGAPTVTLSPLDPAGTREGLATRRPWSDDETVAFDVGAERAALLTLHGALRLFFPYFDVVGDHIDDQLLSVLDGVEGDDTVGYVQRLGRFGTVLQDGHNFYGSLNDTSVVGYAPVKLDHLDGLPVVQRSGVADIAAGDTLVAIDGVDIETVEAAYRTWITAATEGYTLDLVARHLVAMTSEQQVWTLQALDGTTRDVTVTAAAYDASLAVETPEPNGLVDGDIAYVNLDASATYALSQITDLLDQAPAGVILDMRGYPGVNHYDIPELFTSDGWYSPIFNVPVRSVDAATSSEEQYLMNGGDAPYTGPVVLLVGPHSVSAAENFSQIMVATGRVTVVGRPSAGTNGNLTGLWLPGGAYFTWTGMEVRNPDGSLFHGVGIQPDVVVDPTPEEYAAGIDATVAAAITVLRGG